MSLRPKGTSHGRPRDVFVPAGLIEMRTDENAKFFYNTTMKKGAKHEFIEAAHLPRKRPDYNTIQHYFQIDGNKEANEAHHPATPEDHNRSIFLDSLDVILSSIKTIYNQPSFDR